MTILIKNITQIQSWGNRNFMLALSILSVLFLLQI